TEFFEAGEFPLGKSEDGEGERLPAHEVLGDRPTRALELLQSVKTRWTWLLEHLDLRIDDAWGELARIGLDAQIPALRARIDTQADARIFDVLQDHTIRVSWKEEIRGVLKQNIFSGVVFAPTLAKIQDIHDKVLKGRVWVALHMHAGDGNVHTNIPVNSDNYEMLREANEAVDRIMDIARRLNGVISGEHGIGITKYEFLSEEELAPFQEYKRRVDPHDRFNKGKLMPGGDLRHAYTPSFNLMGYESLIMQKSHISDISNAIKDCLRCGKCKPVCATHVPRANLLYSPRNKILATSLLIEAFLYEEQTRRGVSIKHWEEFEDVGDHCTVCHKCVTPCPVDIDFGDVSMDMRQILRDLGKKRF